MNGLENISIFIPFGVFAFILTIFLWITGKKDQSSVSNGEVRARRAQSFWDIDKVSACAYGFMYAVLITIGAVEQLVLPLIVGGFLGLVPIVVFIALTHFARED